MHHLVNMLPNNCIIKHYVLPYGYKNKKNERENYGKIRKKQEKYEIRKY